MAVTSRTAWPALAAILLALAFGNNSAQEDLKIGRQACGDSLCKGKLLSVLNDADCTTFNPYTATYFYIGSRFCEKSLTRTNHAYK